MAKPVIATTFSGLFVNSTPWKNAHRLWFEKRSAELNDPSIVKWKDTPNYFEGVDEIMRRIMPDASDLDRTKQARTWFFNAVLEGLEGARNEDVISFFLELKAKFRIALITTNATDRLTEILKVTRLAVMFDMVQSSLPGEKDNKQLVFERFLVTHGAPALYIGGDKKESYDFCKKHDIPCVFANLENQPEMQDVPSIHKIEELSAYVEKIPRD